MKLSNFATLCMVALLISTSFSIVQSSGVPGLTVTLLGTGTPPPTMERFGPSTLVQANGLNLLFDCGRGCTQRLMQKKVPLGKINVLFLTHLHSDHVVGIPDLLLSGWLPAPWAGRQSPMRVIGPAGTTNDGAH